MIRCGHGVEAELGIEAVGSGGGQRHAPEVQAVEHRGDILDERHAQTAPNGALGVREDSVARAWAGVYSVCARNEHVCRPLRQRPTDGEKRMLDLVYVLGVIAVFALIALVAWGVAKL